MEQYSKRAKNGWRCGKNHKREANKEERIYAKEDIRQELEQYEQGEDFRYKHSSKSTPNKKHQLQSQILHYEKRLESWEISAKQSETERPSAMGSWYINHCNWMRSHLKKLKNTYEEKYENGIENDCR